MSQISIHSTTRVETRPRDPNRDRAFISIHSTTRVETLGASTGNYSKSFQSTPPRGWRRGAICCDTAEDLFQSTPPRGWRRTRGPKRGRKFKISIHSTTRVETPVTSTTRYAWEISIHSTTRVETSLCIIPHGINTDFNPLHHEGGDLIKRYFPMYCNISIHSTTRVETFPLSVILPLFSQFQSTPPRGWRLTLCPSLSVISTISIHSTTRVETYRLP